MAAFRVFVSAVSSEFRQARAAVASDLRSPGLSVAIQEDFQLGDTSTLAKLHDYVRDCDAVLAIIGTRSGYKPPAAAAAYYAAMLPGGFTEASYTQWEIFFAHKYGKRLDRFVAKDWVPEEDAPDDDTALQARLRERLIDVEGIDRHEFTTHDQLLRWVNRRPWPDLSKPKPVHYCFQSLGSLFKGRDGFMATLRESLLAKRKPHVVHGLGGVGKTRLALEYGKAHEADHTALLFASGDTPADLDRALAELAGVLMLPEADATEDSVKYDAALKWLGLHKDWLLVVDNLDTPEALDHAEKVLGALSSGHVIITSRLSSVKKFFEPLHLDVLTPEDATEFLLERTNGVRRGAGDDSAQARAIADDLGWLALPLEQAGAMIEVDMMSLAEYRAAWDENSAKLLDFHDDSMSYPRATAVTWQTSVARLTPAGRAMLERLAFLAPDPVPNFLLDVAIPDVTDDLRAALRDCTKYTLFGARAFALNSACIA